MEHADSPSKKNADPGQHTGPAQNVQAAPGGEADAATGTARHRGREEKHGSINPVEVAPHDTASSVLDGWRHDKARGVGIAGHLAPTLAVAAKLAGSNGLTLLREAAAAVFVASHGSAFDLRQNIGRHSGTAPETIGSLDHPARQHLIGCHAPAINAVLSGAVLLECVRAVKQLATASALVAVATENNFRVRSHGSAPHRLRGSEDQRQHDAGGNGALHDAHRDRCDVLHAVAFAVLRFGAGSGQYACQSSGLSSRTLMPVSRSSVAALFAGMPRDRQLHTVEADSPTAAPSFVGDPSK